MTLSADLRRWALFAVWEDDAALDAFLAAARSRPAGASSAASPTRSGSSRSARTAPGAARTRSHADARRRRVTRGDAGARVAILTRATIRPTKLVPFYRAIAAARGASCAARPGCSPRSARASGRSPARRPSRSGAASPTRAPTPTSAPTHRDVIRATRAERWYAEELFARFRPYGSSGTWDGKDPLASG